MKIDIQMQGVQDAIAYYSKIAQDLPKESNKAVEEVARWGHELAQQLVPFGEGYTHDAITVYPENENIWVIQSAPPSDHPFLPLNIWLEEGDLAALQDVSILGKHAWKYTTQPYSGTFGFMTIMTEQVREEFANRLNLAIRKVISKG